MTPLRAKAEALAKVLGLLSDERGNPEECAWGVDAIHTALVEARNSSVDDVLEKLAAVGMNGDLKRSLLAGFRALKEPT